MSNESNFIKKAMELARAIYPDVRNKEKLLAVMSGEKESTVKNWLFHNKLPASSKRLQIADKFGVTESSLFGDTNEYQVPVAVFNEALSSFLIPQIDEDSLARYTASTPPVKVNARLPLRAQAVVTQDIISPEQTFCFETLHLVYPPFITQGNIVFVNITARLKNNIFCIHKAGCKLQIVHIRCSNGVSLIFNSAGKQIPLDSRAVLFPIILTLSRSY